MPIRSATALTTGQPEEPSLPLSRHSYIEASAHTTACSPTASWCAHFDLAGAVLTEPLVTLAIPGQIGATGVVVGCNTT
jgi:hypothetical protein